MAPVPPQVWLLNLCILLAVAPWAQGGFERSCDYNYGSPRGWCGPQLSQMLSMICKLYNKRSDPSMTMPVIPKQSIAPKSPSVFLPKHEALSLLDKRTYAPGSITCECCIHHCNIRELSSYCSVVNLDKRSQGLYDAIDMSHNSALEEKERKDLQEKQRIGRELMHQGPGWWEAVNQMSAARHNDYHGYPSSGGDDQRGEVYP